MSNHCDFYCFGLNLNGQLGLSLGEDYSSQPIKLNSLNSIGLKRIFTSLKNSDLISLEGTLINCGENERNELARNGKKSLFGRVDLLESFTIIDIVRG